jgi:hypothetical protein
VTVKLSFAPAAAPITRVEPERLTPTVPSVNGRDVGVPRLSDTSVALTENVWEPSATWAVVLGELQAT